MSKRITKTVHYCSGEGIIGVTEDINSWEEREGWTVHQIVMIHHPDRYGGMLVVYARGGTDGEN